MAKDMWRMGCALLLGVAVAFPAGMMFAGRDSAGPARGSGPPASGAAGMRNAYSPNVTRDPYVLDQQRKLAEALEMQCRRFHERCAEAEQARRWIDDASE